MRLPAWSLVLFIAVALFPPYTQRHLYNPQIESAAGWTFIGALGPRQSIRWGVLVLELVAVAGVGLVAARRTK